MERREENAGRLLHEMSESLDIDPGKLARVEGQFITRAGKQVYRVRLGARLHTSQYRRNDEGFSAGFPTVSYRFSSREGVRMDVTEPRKSSSCANHCLLLIRLGAGKGFNKIPLPAPHVQLPRNEHCKRVRAG